MGKERRERLLETLRRLVADERALAAIEEIPREAFLPPALASRAYENVALSIGEGQTISQPLVVARMLELLSVKPGERVLDVGTGSGYHAALLAHLGAEVLSIERRPALSRRAAEVLRELGLEGVELLVGDGARGVPSRAPFDAINVAAAAPLQAIEKLRSQLRAGGRLVAPAYEDPLEPGAQRLVLLGADGSTRRCEAVRFVPLVTDRDPRAGAG